MGASTGTSMLFSSSEDSCMKEELSSSKSFGAPRCMLVDYRSTQSAECGRIPPMLLTRQGRRTAKYRRKLYREDGGNNEG